MLDEEHIQDLIEIEELDKGFINMMMKNFKENASETLVTIDEGLQKDDLEIIKFHTHKLQGTAGSLGAKNLAEKSKSLEQMAKKEADISQIKNAIEELKLIYKETTKNLEERFRDFL